MMPDPQPAASRPEPREILARTILVVPCYNEARRLDGDRVIAFLQRVAGLHILFVNDGSTDGTADVLHELCDRAPGRASVLTLERNSGKAEAVRRGMLQALDQEPGFIGYWDADLATPLDALAGFAHVLGRADDVELVMGARVQLLGRTIERHATRHYAGRVFATFASLTLRLPVYDTQCGAKLFRVRPDTRALFEEPFSSSWIFDVEILSRLGHLRRSAPGGGAKDLGIWEYPLLEWHDVKGSKLGLRDYFKAAFELAVIWGGRRRMGKRMRRLGQGLGAGGARAGAGGEELGQGLADSKR